MSTFGSYIMPVMLIFIIIYGVLNKVPVFDTFLSGAKSGIYSVISITPALLGLVTSVSMLKASGALELLTSAIKPITDLIGLPADVVPLMILRPVSGSGSLAIVDNIFSTNGVDSFVGKIASVMMGSTETTFYAIAIYYGSVGIKKTRHTIHSTMVADIICYFMAVLTVNLLF